MKQFYLSEIVTKDKLIHQGIYYSPTNHGKRALLWVHGLTSTFYNALAIHEVFADACEKEGWGYASFNNRGHDLVSGIRKENAKNPKGYTHAYGGGGYEVFEESVHDIDAGITFLSKQGFSEIILVGHSTGANKVCYYVATQKDPRVGGVVLAGPVSDRLDTSIDQKKLVRDLEDMQKLIKQGKGDELVLGYHYFPMTPKRFISLFFPRSTEDTFDYGDHKPVLKYFSQIKQPLLVVIGEKDEYLDRPVEKVMKVSDTYQNSTGYKSVVIPNALHGFNGREEKFVQSVVGWVKTI